MWELVKRKAKGGGAMALLKWKGVGDWEEVVELTKGGEGKKLAAGIKIYYAQHGINDAGMRIYNTR